MLHLLINFNLQSGAQVEQASLDNNCPIPASNLEIHGPEPKSGFQSQSQDKLCEDKNVHSEFQTEDLHGSNQPREMNFNLVIIILFNMLTCFLWELWLTLG